MTVKDRTDDMEPSETSESEEDILDSDDEVTHLLVLVLSRRLLLSVTLLSAL